MGRFLLLMCVLALAVWTAALLRRAMRGGRRAAEGRIIEGRFRVLGESQPRHRERESGHPPRGSR